VETVGAGQSEVEVMSFAHTVVLVLTPAGGDDVQALKAGIMEIADVFVVNKADLPGAVNTVSYVRGAIDASTRTDGWRPPVLSTRADRGEGVDELLDAIESHQRHLVETGGLAQRERRRRRAEVETLVLRRLERGVQRRLDADLAELDGEGSAVEVAVELMERWAPGLATT
jgi:LAO/AO transport system kinase